MIELTRLWTREAPNDWNVPWTPSAEQTQKEWINIDHIVKISLEERYHFQYSSIVWTTGTWDNFLETPQQIIKMIDHVRQWNRSVSINDMKE